MTGLERARRRYAQALIDGLPPDAEAAAVERRRALRRAFATVPRERHLGPPPWVVRRPPPVLAESTRDPRAVYADVLVELDTARRLNNGSPGLWAGVFDALAIGSGERVVHVGAGAGYYSAILAELVGSRGRVAAIELEPHLAEQARIALAGDARVAVVCADGTTLCGEPAHVVVVNAGATRVAEAWLDALAPGGRLYVPLTVSPADPLEGIGVGVGFVFERRDDGFAARFVGTVGMYPCLGGRSAADQEALHAALGRGPESFGAVRSLRREPHAPEASCWCHVSGACLSERDPGD